MYDLKEIENDLKDMLSTFRYEHSLLSANEAKLLAQYYNLDYNKAYIAGLVHDIAKELTDEENKYWIDKYNIDDIFLKHKPVLHAEVGYYLLKEKYNMPEDICRAVRYHALGNIKMTLFDKIIFIADKVGRSNKDESLEKVKTVAYQNIDNAILLCLEYQKNKLHNLGQEMHHDSLELLNAIKL